MDIAYLLLLQRFREVTGDVLNNFFNTITEFGNGIIFYAALAGIYWAVSKKTGIYLLFNLMIGNLVNGFLKLTACVYRPWVRDVRVQPVPAAKATATGYSFPSGHTAQAMSLWGGLAVSYRKRAKAIMWASIAILLLICFSRNYLGVHTPQDVIVSFCFGLIILFIMAKVLKWVEKAKNNDIILTVVVSILSILTVVYVSVKSYPIDYDEAGKILVDPKNMLPDTYFCAGCAIGIALGWLLEKRFVKFSTDDIPALIRVKRFLCGLPCVVFLFTGFLWISIKWFGMNPGCFIAGFIMQLFILFFYPLIFTGFEKKHPD